MDDLRQPQVRKETLDYLKQLFPDRLPELADTDRQIWFNRGAAEVIRHLQHLYDQQQTNILGT
jgi:hypothetical protein